MRSHLARHQPESPIDDDQLRRMRSAAWHRQGVAVVRLDEIQDDWLRQGLENYMNTVYGRRKGGQDAR